MAGPRKVNVIVAIGIEIRRWSYTSELIDFLNTNATVIRDKINQWTYSVPRKNLYYIVSIVYSFDEFRTALDTENAYVIYDGHSRWGQGPAFGDTSLHCPSPVLYPTNPWQDTFKMGWDTIRVPCIEEIFDHCTDPEEYPHTRIPARLFAKKNVKRMLNKSKGRSQRCNQRGYAKRLLRNCYPQFAQKLNGRGVKPLLNRHYWIKKRNEEDFYTLIQVGQRDLDSVSLKCRVLFMNSCSSKGHFYYALKRQKRRKKSKCNFYMTRYSCGAATTLIFIKLLFKGYRPTGRNGSRRFLRAMGVRNSGVVQYLK